MALPGSGTLSIDDIRIELGASSTNQSLGAFSDTAGFSAPDAISDFYGYAFRSIAQRYNLVVGKPATQCDLERAFETNVYFEIGTGLLGDYPSTGNICYTTSTGVNYLAAANYSMGTNVNFNPDFPIVIVTIGIDGEVTATYDCI